LIAALRARERSRSIGLRCSSQRPFPVEVDHIVPLAQGGEPYRLDGLQGILLPLPLAENRG